MDADVSGSVFGATEDDKKVLIIGAGITGLALAHGLKKVNAPRYHKCATRPVFPRS